MEQTKDGRCRPSRSRAQAGCLAHSMSRVVSERVLWPSRQLIPRVKLPVELPSTLYLRRLGRELSQSTPWCQSRAIIPQTIASQSYRPVLHMNSLAVWQEQNTWRCVSTVGTLRRAIHRYDRRKAVPESVKYHDMWSGNVCAISLLCTYVLHNSLSTAMCLHVMSATVYHHGSCTVKPCHP